MRIKDLYEIVEKNASMLHCYNVDKDEINNVSNTETIMKNIREISRMRSVINIVSRYLPIKLNPMSYQKISLYTNNENICLQYPSCWDAEDVVDVIQHLGDLLDWWCLRKTNLESEIRPSGEIRPSDAKKIYEIFGEEMYKC